MEQHDEVRQKMEILASCTSMTIFQKTSIQEIRGLCHSKELYQMVCFLLFLIFHLNEEVQIQHSVVELACHVQDKPRAVISC